jgi:hypothetical protein
MDDNGDIKFSGMLWLAEFLAFAGVPKGRIAVICMAGQFQKMGLDLDDEASAIVSNVSSCIRLPRPAPHMSEIFSFLQFVKWLDFFRL